jgi:D-psicose/D-tagatose/L-ribulose 3-epimerase
MKFGVHIALWMKSWQEDVTPHLERAADLGFDGVELSLLGTVADNPTRVRKALKALRLEVTCTTGLSLEHDITSDDPEMRQAGLRYLEGAIARAAALGSPLLSGVIYAPWGQRTMVRRGERWQRSIETLKAVASFALDHGLTLGIEAINRFETDLVTTAAQANRMAEEVDEANVGVLLDTYHMNIEEKRVAQALRDSKRHLVHLHCSENDRGAPGSGHVPWGEVFEGLEDIGYDRWVTLEMFVQPDEAVSSDLAIWRTIEPNPSEAARQGLAFLREHLT